MSKFKEEHYLIIAPGSQTTLAQLGVPDQLTPAKIRIPTRVFPSAKPGEYEPHKLRPRTTKVKRPAPAASLALPVNGQADSNRQTSGAEGTAIMNGASDIAQPIAGEIEEEETFWEESLDDDEGAIYPIDKGRIVDRIALLALFTHIDQLLSPPMHSPVMVICDPAWTNDDRETIAQFYFQQFSRPGLSFVDSALAIGYAYGVLDGVVVDMGFQKASVTALVDSMPIEPRRVATLEGAGGAAINAALMVYRALSVSSGEVAGPEFTFEMAEQLKKDRQICEVLPEGVAFPMESAETSNQVNNPAATVSNGVEGTKQPNPAAAGGGPSNLPRGPGAGTQTGVDDSSNEQDGVLDIASIVASGKTSEILAKRESEQASKVTKGGNKKGAPVEPPKPARVPNSQKPKVKFRYTERIKASALNGTNGSANEGQPETALPEDSYVYQSKETEVGTERFCGYEENDLAFPIGSAINQVIASAPSEKRNELWSNIMIVGNGSKVKGLKERLIEYIKLMYVVHSFNDSMFVSELPSNFSTPLATGANTPQPPPLGHANAGTPTPGDGRAVNPLLHAALTQSQNSLAPPGSQTFQASLQPGTSTPGGPGHTQHPHQISAPSHQTHQGPMNIRMTQPKEYYPEWKDHGFEEAIFLGAQLAAKSIFGMDTGPQLSYMTRQNFNEDGPSGIHAYSMC